MALDDSHLPAQLADFWSFYAQAGTSVGLQKYLSSKIFVNAYNNYLASLSSPFSRARVVSCTAQHSGLWLSTLPTTSEFILSTGHFNLALRLRIGVPPQDNLPVKCRCNTVLLSDDPNHFLSCKLFRRSIVTTRHDLIVRWLASTVRRVGGSAFIEPKYCDGKRPDAKVFLADYQCSIDASVTHPASPSYCSAAVSSSRCQAS
ncbi:MAG: hypothetical protein ACRDF4_04790 [Rhabdochlamydiaceae bacterium]